LKVLADVFVLGHIHS